MSDRNALVKALMPPQLTSGPEPRWRNRLADAIHGYAPSLSDRLNDPTSGAGMITDAVGTMVASPIEAMAKYFANPYQPGERTPENRNALMHGFEAAGLAQAGAMGVGRATMPRNAIGSAGGTLDMSDAARMARAKAMGFDVDRVWYHGTNQPLDTITPGMRDPGAWFASQVNDAASYARGDDAQVYSTRLRTKNPMVVESLSDVEFIPAVAGEPLNLSNNVDIVRHAFRLGHDAVHFPWGNFSEAGNTMVVRDGNQIRAVDAAFDPEKSGLPNLMYGLAGLMALGAANPLLQGQEPPSP